MFARRGGGERGAFVPAYVCGPRAYTEGGLSARRLCQQRHGPVGTHGPASADAPRRGLGYARARAAIRNSFVVCMRQANSASSA